MSTGETKILDIRFVSAGIEEGLYVDGKLDHARSRIEANEIALAASGSPFTLQCGWVETTEDEIGRGTVDFPEDISGLDRREKEFRVKWHDI